MHEKPKVQERSKLDLLNEKVSPVTAVVAGVLLYDGFTTDSSRSVVIGGSLALLSGMGLADRIARLRDRRKEKTVFESPPPVEKS